MTLDALFSLRCSEILGTLYNLTLPQCRSLPLLQLLYAMGMFLSLLSLENKSLRITYGPTGIAQLVGDLRNMALSRAIRIFEGAKIWRTSERETL